MPNSTSGFGWSLALLLAITACDGCENYGEEAETTAVLEGTDGADEAGDTDEVPPAACAPILGEQVGERYRCDGFGVGAALIEYVGGSPFRCVTDPTQYSLEDCVANPLPLSEVYDQSSGWIEQPAACCQEVDQASLDLACAVDCAYASCMWSVYKLRETADALSCANLASAECRLRNDLFAAADLLEDSKLHACAETIWKNAGNTVAYSLGSLGGNSTGNIENVTLYLGCDIEAAVIEEPAQECMDAVHTVPEQPDAGVVPGVVVVSSGSSTVTVPVLGADARFEVEARCTSDTCGIDLLEFDATLGDVALGSFELEDIEVRLAAPVRGTLHGSEVVFDAGAMTFVASAVVRRQRQLVLGPEPVEFEFTANSVVKGSLESNRLAIRFAEFEQGGVIACLNTEGVGG